MLRSRNHAFSGRRYPRPGEWSLVSAPRERVAHAGRQAVVPDPLELSGSTKKGSKVKAGRPVQRPRRPTAPSRSYDQPIPSDQATRQHAAAIRGVATGRNECLWKRAERRGVSGAHARVGLGAATPRGSPQRNALPQRVAAGRDPARRTRTPLLWRGSETKNHKRAMYVHSVEMNDFEAFAHARRAELPWTLLLGANGAGKRRYCASRRWPPRARQRHGTDERPRGTAGSTAFCLRAGQTRRR